MEKPKELEELIDSLACLNEGIALLQTVEKAIEEKEPEYICITFDKALEQLVAGRDGLIRAGVKSLPVKSTMEYFEYKKSDNE